MRVNNFVRLKHSSGYISICIYAAFLSACGPNSKEQALQAEKKRIECLDKFCTGDVDPRSTYENELLKFNGHWYTAPKYYFSSGMNGASFNWPSKKSREDIPQSERANSVTHGVEIYLRGRARWPDPNISKPWEGNIWESRFEEMRKRNFRIDRALLNAGLERVRLIDPSGKQYRHEFFIATDEKRAFGDDPPVVACEPYPYSAPGVEPTCTGWFYWREDIFADFRFHAKYAQDWPAIYQEIVRVLGLVKKIQS